MATQTIIDGIINSELKKLSGTNPLQALGQIVTKVEKRTYPHAIRYAYNIGGRNFFHSKPLAELSHEDAKHFLRASGWL